MMNHNTHCQNITLPLLIAYIEALLPVLQANSATQTVTDGNKNDNADDQATELLWVAQDNTAMLVLDPQLNHKLAEVNGVNDGNGGNNRQPSNSHLSTLSVLVQQPILERYELACFWLPTLSAELLQQYIPLLMRYRDLYATHLLVALDSTIDLRAYGFTPFDILSEQTALLDTIEPLTSLETTPSATLWQFNLYDYKQLPNWLNADYWANPENWDKRRW
ncbi:hypothetical protein RCH20_002293 [Psychrobacter sp. PL15]|uniref:DUF6231 family protein n=1 Tax=unclassified Psychrobacter TaxID=196806 RepID=UPI001AE4F405|nr:DUF6231 family protein [Psychrobacter sp. PL15]MEC5211210.1 hypothetical protein [Psychrobacter sp. PL15]